MKRPDKVLINSTDQVGNDNVGRSIHNWVGNQIYGDFGNRNFEGGLAKNISSFSYNSDWEATGIWL